MQANEWLTMGNGRYVRQLDPMLTLDTRPEPVRAVRQPHLQDDPVHKVPAVRHGGVPAVRAVGVPDNQEDMMREPLMKSPSVQMKQVQEVPHVQQDESDEGVPVQEGGGVGTIDDPADQGYGVRDGDAHDLGKDGPKKPPDEDNAGDGPVHTEGGDHVSDQATVDDVGGAVSVQTEEGGEGAVNAPVEKEADITKVVDDKGDVHVPADIGEGGGAAEVTEEADIAKVDNGGAAQVPVPVDDTGGDDQVQVTIAASGGHVQDPIDEGGGATSVQDEEEREVAQNVADIGDVHVNIHIYKCGGAIHVTERRNNFYTLTYAATEQYKQFQLNQSKKNYRGEDGIQVNEWMTMGNRRGIAVQQPPIQYDPVHEAPWRGTCFRSWGST
jgi:hypothetical protein